MAKKPEPHWLLQDLNSFISNFGDAADSMIGDSQSAREQARKATERNTKQLEAAEGKLHSLRKSNAEKLNKIARDERADAEKHAEKMADLSVAQQKAADARIAKEDNARKKAFADQVAANKRDLQQIKDIEAAKRKAFAGQFGGDMKTSAFADDIGSALDKAFGIASPVSDIPMADPKDVMEVRNLPKASYTPKYMPAVPPPLPPKKGPWEPDFEGLKKLARMERRKASQAAKTRAAAEHADPMGTIGLPTLAEPPGDFTSWKMPDRRPPPPSMWQKMGMFGAGVAGLFGKLTVAIGTQIGKGVATIAGALFGKLKGAGGGAWDFAKKIFGANWDYIDTKILPVQSALNKALGATTVNLGALRSQANNTGEVFQDLGLGFEKGAKDVTALAAGLRQTKIPNDTLQSLLKLSEYVGVGAEQAAEFARSFQSSGGALRELDKVFAGATQDAKEFNVPVNLIRKDMAQNINVMQRFGSVNAVEFRRATARAQELGLSISDMFDAFGENLDTFENTNDIAAILNQTFGTQLDSIKLLNEQNIDKRYEMIRKSLADVNIEWDTMGTSMQNVLKQQFNLNNEQAAGFFGSQKEIMQAKRRAAENEKNVKITNDWNSALQSLRLQVLDVSQVFEGLFRAIGDVVARFFGFKSGIDGTKAGLMGWKGLMGDLTTFFKQVALAMPDNYNGFEGLAKWVKELGYTLKAMGTTLDYVGDVAFDLMEDFDAISSPAKHATAGFIADEYLKGGSARVAALQQYNNSSLSDEQTRRMIERKLLHDAKSRGMSAEYRNKLLESLHEERNRGKTLYEPPKTGNPGNQSSIPKVLINQTTYFGPKQIMPEWSRQQLQSSVYSVY